MALVLDTDVVSFLYKRDSRADLYRPHLTGHMLTISFMTLAELERWTLSANWGRVATSICAGIYGALSSIRPRPHFAAGGQR